MTGIGEGRVRGGHCGSEWRLKHQPERGNCRCRTARRRPLSLPLFFARIALLSSTFSPVSGVRCVFEPLGHTVACVPGTAPARHGGLLGLPEYASTTASSPRVTTWRARGFLPSRCETPNVSDCALSIILPARDGVTLRLEPCPLRSGSRLRCLSLTHVSPHKSSSKMILKTESIIVCI